MSAKCVLSRREFLAGAATVAAGTILVACTPTPAPTAKPTAASAATAAPATKAPQATQPPAATPVPATSGGKVISYWFCWALPYVERWNKIAATQEFKQIMGPDTVEIKSSVNMSVLLPAVAAGTPPDVMACSDYLDLMYRGQMFPLDELIAKSTIKKSDFLPLAWESGFWKGKQYMVPHSESSTRYGFCYNAKLVSEAGFDPNKPPLTWSELLAWHKKLTTFDKAGNLSCIGLDPFTGIPTNIAYSNGWFAPDCWGVKWFDENTGKLDLDNDKMAESFDVMAEFVKIAGPDKRAALWQAVEGGTESAAYVAGVEAMALDGYWHASRAIALKPEIKEHYRNTWVPMPDSRAGTKLQVVGTHYAHSFRDAKYPQGCIKVAEVANTTAAMDICFKGQGRIGPVLSFADSINVEANPDLKFLTFYVKSRKEATELVAPPRAPIYNYIVTTYKQEAEEVFRGRKSGKQAAKDLQAGCEKEIKKVGL